MRSPFVPWLRSGLSPAVTLLSLAFLSASAPAQVTSSPNENAPAAKPTALPTAYDVISIRPHKQGDPSGYWRTSASGFSASVPLRSLITSAYGVFMQNQLSGLPGWAETDTFDVEVKLDPDNAEAVNKLQGEERRNERDLLMRALLADRFKMKAHIEVKDLPVYNLVIARGGIKMKEAAPDEPGGYRMGMGNIKGKAVPIGSMIATLSNPSGRFIVNKTGLTGRYEVDLTWAWQDDPNATGPSLFTALEEQLGLKLEPAKAPLDVVVIDHIERPSEN